MIRPEIQSLATPITQLKPHPQNVRQGDVGAISLSLEQHGQYRPIVVQQSTGFILAGNHTYKAAKALKWKDIAATYVDVDDEQALRILLIDNRANDLASYDDSALVEMLKALMDTELKLDGTGFDPSDLDQLLKDLEMETGNPIEGDPDAVPDDAPSKTVPGDVWLLGNHRLMCGDSTSPTDIEHLMSGVKADMVFTDPPYNADYSSRVDKTRRKPWGGILNDNMPEAKFAEFVFDIFCMAKPSIKPNAAVYCWTDWKRYPIVASAFSDQYNHKSTIVWDKGHFGLGTYYRTQYELCLFGVNGDKLKTWNAGHDEKDVWAQSRETFKNYVHPTQKPIELAQRAINNSSNTDDLILDLFGGSGSTLIAAHQTGRIAYLMELDPHYCDVICKRFQQATGITPIAEATGNEHSFIE